MYTDNPAGPEFYHKAIELQPDSYDIRWSYYTTLEEIVENHDVPDLLEDAIDCLNFCIDCCSASSEPQNKKRLKNLYYSIARLYMRLGEFSKARDSAEKSLSVGASKGAEELFAKAKKLAQMTDDINAFYRKYRSSRLDTKEDETGYINGADRIADDYEGTVKTLIEKKPLCDFFGVAGSKLIMYAGNLTDGVRFYHKAMELLRFSFDVHWGYYTTLEEIIEDESHATPELIADAIKCLNVCISALTTPALKKKNHIELRYYDLAKVYMIAKDYAKAKEAAEKSLEIAWDEDVQELLDEAEGMLSE